ncbi:hypothetical protein Peur_069872 [Populus x canadensis]
MQQINMFESAAEIKCRIKLLAQQLEAEDMVLEILKDSQAFLIGNGIIKGHSSAEFTVVLGVRFDTTDLHRFEVEIQYRFTIICGQSEKTNVKSTTYKTQVQSPTGQGRSTLRYWAFSDSYPFQQ